MKTRKRTGLLHPPPPRRRRNANLTHQKMIVCICGCCNRSHWYVAAGPAKYEYQPAALWHYYDSLSRQIACSVVVRP